MITIHQRHRRTDRRTGGQTTCDRNTGLCTKVHRAVKITIDSQQKVDIYEKSIGTKINDLDLCLESQILEILGLSVLESQGHA